MWFLLQSNLNLQDDKYIDLAQDPENNEEELQKMVIDAAKSAGLFKKGVGEETNIFIPDSVNKHTGKLVSFTDLILDGKKKGETRKLSVNLPIGKWIGIAKRGKVVGRIILGNPDLINNKSYEYEDSYIQGTDYDIEDGETKKYYPIVKTMDLRNHPRDVLRFGRLYGAYQFKLPNIVTYDDNYEIIPLSKRFDLNKEDIRY